MSASSNDDSNSNKKIHESVILRATSAADSRMRTAVLPDGKTASLPSTLGADGKLLLPKSTAAGDDLIGSFIPSIASDTYSVASNSQGQNDQGGLQTDSRLGLTAPRTASPNRSTSAPGSVGSRGSRSRGSSRSGNANPKELLGPPQCLVLRLEGDILPIETTIDTIEKGPQNGVINGHIVLTDIHHIPTSKAIALELIKAASMNSSGIIIMIISPKSSSLSSLAAPPEVNRINVPVDSERHKEVRQIAESVIFDLFRTLGIIINNITIIISFIIITII